MKKLSDNINEVQENIGYYFKDNIDLLYQAFTRSSWSTENGGENNEVLEFIGDRVLDLCVTKELTERYGFFKSDSKFFDEENDYNDFCIKAHKNEQKFTEIKKELVSNKNLANVIDNLELAQFMYLGDSDFANKVWKETKVKADLFEAIIGAITLDSKWDLDEIQNLICDLLEIDEFLSEVEDGQDEYPAKCQLENAINSLKELFEHGYISEPIYTVPDEQIEYEGEFRWSAEVYIRSHRIQRAAVSNSKKAAKRYAAYLALCEYYDVEPIE